VTHGPPLRWTALGLALALCVGASGQAQEAAAEQRSRVEAAFLRNFARYVGWPASAFAGERSPWHVCILGDDHFGDALDRTLQDRIEQGRPFTILRDAASDQLASCQIVYVGYESAARRRAALEAFKRMPVLTVGHAPEFLQEGGIIRLTAADRIEMSINLDQARAASLTIPAKMLEVSRDVIDQGVQRRWR
jgi:hypothetical protein